MPPVPSVHADAADHVSAMTDAVDEDSLHSDKPSMVQPDASDSASAVAVADADIKATHPSEETLPMESIANASVHRAEVVDPEAEFAGGQVYTNSVVSEAAQPMEEVTSPPSAQVNEDPAEQGTEEPTNSKYADEADSEQLNPGDHNADLGGPGTSEISPESDYATETSLSNLYSLKVKRSWTRKKLGVTVTPISG